MNKRITRMLKLTAVRLCAVGALGVLVAGAILYQRGYYDFTFIERVPMTAPSDAESPDTAPSPVPPKETEAVTPPPTETDHLTETDAAENQESRNPEMQQKPEKPAKKPDTPKSVSASLLTSDAAHAKGYRPQTSGVYTPASILAKLNIPGLGRQYSYADYEARSLKVTEYERGCIYTEEITQTQRRPAVQLRNGYIIRSKKGGGMSLLRPNGKTVLSDYDESTFLLTDRRDENGNPLFAGIRYETQEVPVPILVPNEFTGRPEESGQFEEEPVRKTVEIRTYYTLSEDGKWVESAYTEDPDAPVYDTGLFFDFPQDYVESDCDLERFFQYGRWGYKSKKTGKTVIFPRFTKAYNFKDGYALAFDGFTMYVLDASGNTVFSTGYNEPEVFVTFNEITFPDTRGIEALGCYYFSHGLTRVRIRENLYTYKLYNYIKADDYTALINIHGEPFPLPAGYTLQSYSDGMILLKKNDEELYGFMNYKGQWIVQPEYTYARPFLSGLAVVGSRNGKKGLVDTNGNFVLPQIYDAVSDVSSGMTAVYDKTLGWEVYRMMTR